MCALRLSNECNFECYENSKCDISPNIHPALTKYIDPVRCFLCFSILTSTNIDSTIEGVRKALQEWPKDSDHVVSEAQLMITTPALMTLAEILTISYLEIKEEIKIKQPCIEIKEILKYLISKEIML